MDNDAAMLASKSSRREFLRRSAVLGVALALPGDRAFSLLESAETPGPLELFSYSEVRVESAPHIRQRDNTYAVLMGLNEDGLMRPFRMMSGLPAPGEDLGGWYMYKADYDYRKDSAGLCPGGTFGQWVSALARYSACTGDESARRKVVQLNQQFAQSLRPGYFDNNRFPGYCYDKLVCGLIDSHQFAGDANAFSQLEQLTNTALPFLPPHAVDREQSWRKGKEDDISYTWDESYTLPENLFLAYQRGAGSEYKDLAVRFLDDKTYFDPLAAGINVFPGKHAYSYVNALNSAIQAYLILGSEKHLRAARNGFEMLATTQSFATGGWGPDEMLREPGTGALAASLVDQNKSFETPCGAYAHFKLTRSLLRIGRDSRYGDSMEQVMYNTVLGAKPLQPDGTAFYYSDYTYKGSKRYSKHRWPCCSGTLPQIAVDYGISIYFHDFRDLYISLYIPSTVRWVRGTNNIVLRQKSEYPFTSVVDFDLTASQAEEFSLRFRIPAWANGASISVNGKMLSRDLRAGEFAEVHRVWTSGDRIELSIPMHTSLEPIDAQHPNIVALKYGPLVLFPIAASSPRFRREELLAAKRSAEKSWRVETKSGPLTLLPFSEITNETYTTYVRVR